MSELEKPRKPKTFTTTMGVEIQLAPVPPMLVEEVRLRAIKERPVPPIPTYEVELMDGSKQLFQHDQDSVVDPNTKESEKIAWRDYQRALADQNSHSGNKVMELFLAKGTVISLDEIRNGDWKEIQQYFGVELPENAVQLKIHYLRTELLTSVADIQNIMSAIMEASGVDQEALEAARASFRRELRKETDTTGRPGGDVQAEEQGEMEHVDTVPRAGDGESMAPDPRPMG